MAFAASTFEMNLEAITAGHRGDVQARKAGIKNDRV
jgi:hypothetical protein